MKEGRPSTTAEGAAAVRAAEALRPAHQRVFEDPYAHCFLTLRYRARLWPGLRTLFERFTDRIIPGVIPYAVARARWMDDVIVGAAPECEQIVILGAGYDTTFARHPELPERVPYFEVDHPDTQRAKRAGIAARPDLFGERYGKVKPVAVNFEREDLAARLAEEGYRRWRRTLFLWSGVAMYLQPEAVEATLGVIGQAAPGSHLIVDLVERRAFARADAARVQGYFAKLGEPLLFAIDTEELKDFLGRFGMQVEETIDGEGLRARYFAADDPRRIAENAYLVHARVG